MESKVKEYRLELEMTQKELSKKVGVSRKTINWLKNEKYNPSLILAHKITIMLGKEIINDIFIFDKEDLKK
ncbi:hypothetical protein ALNOE001_16280 [Candidatus Methanobinarius endosymbioticus]|uniref:HTH cro/C1-type domain-containing protein n=1 Tax=Candidatus Methanobinarius endosymbioticus TaxID=2006182 RepID=A0A366M8V0_9EURY|nr:hypothetical protein ALNOE001_16280 [Candidatus Methanobinarius endosymbioticus]